MKNDIRSKKIALISHCILNQNAVIGGGAKYTAAIPNVMETLKAHKFSIVQLPCPEMYAAGLDRWGQVKEQYSNSGFKRSFRMAVKFALDNIEDYVVHGFQIVVIGIEGSPSCGIGITESDPSWGGTIDGFKEENLTIINARGVFMDILFEGILARGWQPFPAIGLSSDVDENMASVKLLDDFLSAFD